MYEPVSQVVSGSLVRRLAFARYVFRHGEGLAQLPPPANAAALLSLQDAVELLLLAACEQLHVPLKEKAALHDYLSGLQAAYGQAVPFSVVVQRLNKTRVSLKHYGVMPAPDDVVEFASGAGEFLRANTRLAFGLAFDDVSLQHLVQDFEVRFRLLEAESCFSQGNYGFCIDLATLAMRRVRLVYDPHQRHFATSGYRQSPTDLIGRWSHGLRHLGGSRVAMDAGMRDLREELDGFVKDVSQSITMLSEQLDALSLGLEWSQYRRQRSFCHAEGMMDGSTVLFQGQGQRLTKDDARFALDFVTDAALRLQATVVDPAEPTAPPTVPQIHQTYRLERAKSGIRNIPRGDDRCNRLLRVPRTGCWPTYSSPHIRRTFGSDHAS